MLAFLRIISSVFGWVYTLLHTGFTVLLSRPVILIGFLWAAVTYFFHILGDKFWGFVVSRFSEYFYSFAAPTVEDSILSANLPLMGYIASLCSLDTLVSWVGTWCSSFAAGLVCLGAVVATKLISRVIP